MRAMRLAVTFFVLLIASRSAVAGPIGYSVDFTTKDLYSIDFTTATATLIGSTGITGTAEALALSPSGALYATNSSGLLYSVNVGTGLASLIGNTGLGNVEGLDFNGSTLVGTNFSGSTSLYSINTATAAATFLTTSSPGQGLTRAMAIENANTALILTDSPTFQSLHAVNLTTGALTTRGATITPTGIYGMDFAGSTLYGVGAAGELFTINAATGLATLIGDTGDQVWLNLAMAPEVAEVPEPTSVVLLGLGGLGLIAARKRRQAA